MLRKNGGRALAYIVTVDKVEPIEGYDRIELATVGGWRCVVARGMAAGDKAVYFEIDSLLPRDDKRFAFCEKYKWRVKTQRMCRGAVLSQGLLMPVSAFPELQGLEPGDDVTALLRVSYWEPGAGERKAKAPDKYALMARRHKKLFAARPIRWLMGRDWGRRLLFLIFGRRKDIRAEWPRWVGRTDEERVQNIPWILEPDTQWVATEKIDGMSATFTMKRHGKLIVCSRNRVVTDGVWAEVAERYHAKEVLEALLKARPTAKWVTVQGEAYGAGVQKRDYGNGGHRFAAFNLIYSDTGRVGTIEMVRTLTKLGVPCVPVLGENWVLPKTVDEVIDIATGDSMIDGGMREGIVFRSPDGGQSFKAVSNEYLLKYHA